MGCTGRGVTTSQERSRKSLSGDTLYTDAKAMAVYDYLPERALLIIDSAVAVGNLSEAWADVYRAKIFSQTMKFDFRRYDSAQAICERLLSRDVQQADTAIYKNVLEILVNVSRLQEDTAGWLRRSQELVDVLHRQGARNKALRTEAEIGASLYYMGQQAQGLAMLDRVINTLNASPVFKFNELDALIIATKREIGVLDSEGRYAEMLPLLHHILERLDDYEQHPQDYHDGNFREPVDSTGRADYIHFYRSQAQGFLTAAYTALGDRDNMKETFYEIEHTVREATAREHIARYRALEHQLLRTQAEHRSHIMLIIAITAVAGLLLLSLFAVYTYSQKRRIQQKSHALVKLIEEQTRQPQKAVPQTDQAFQAIDTAIRTERLYADTNFQRKDICERFNIRREVLNQMLTDHANGLSFPAYINSIRLTEACRLLKDEPAKTVNAIADEVGLMPRNLRRLFVEQYGMTPTEYREGLK